MNATDMTLIRALTRAARAGTEFDIHDGELRIRGPIPDELLKHRDTIRTLLLTDTCAACGAPAWIREHATAIPWCRPCANRRGTQLLRHEQPGLIATPIPTQEVA